MTAEQLKELLTDTESFNKAVEAIEKEKTGTDQLKKYLKQYNVEDHDVFDAGIRKNKPIEDKDGKPKGEEPVNRIGAPLQQIIASRAAAFICANPIVLGSTPNGAVEENLLAGIKKVWDDNKLDYDTMELAEIMLSETEVAELWYAEEADKDYWAETNIKSKVKPRMVILSPSKGDTLIPVKDPTGDMIAFARGYVAKSDDGKDVERFDIYTNTFIYELKKDNNDWKGGKKINTIKKIPVIYYQHPKGKPEWSQVQSSIDRLEAKISNHADTNDYYDSPILFIEGEIGDMAMKGDSGKVIQSSNGAKASYLTWNEAPASTKLEIDNLFRIIYSCTDTPDLSFDNLKGLMPSGVAMEFMFMGAHLKAARHAGPFGKCIQRRINYIAAVLASTDTSLKPALKMAIKPKFEFYMPKDLEGMVNTLSTAVTGKILSKKTAINNLPGLVTDVDAELKQIDKEDNSASALDNLNNQ